MQKLGWKFYVPLLVLTLGVLGLLAAWLSTRNDALLYGMLGLFPVYLFHLIFGLAMNGRGQKRSKELRSSFLLLAGNGDVGTVYLTYLGGERRIKKPSLKKKDYLVEFYAAGVDRSLLKRHLWFGLSEEDERALLPFFIGGMEVPYPFLADLSGKTILAQAEFLRAAEEVPAFDEVMKQNEWIPYGE